MRSKEQLEAAVEEGIRFLNVKVPDWIVSMVPESLRMIYSSCCVLAQVHQSFGSAMLKLGLTDEDVVRMGFQADDIRCKVGYAILDDIWKRRIIELKEQRNALHAT